MSGPIWIDLANSPHVLFFAPLIEELERRGLRTVVTARDFAQTLPLCARLGIEAEVIGRHGGSGLPAKGATLVSRVRDLREFARQASPSAAVSHNSYAQLVAARSLRLPVMTAMDYEYQPANHLAFRCADLVAVPSTFPLDRLWNQGGRHKAWRYTGLKEHIVLAGFEPDPGYLMSAGVETGGRALAVVRPPASMALYHRFENHLFPGLLRHLQRTDSVRPLVLPRTPEQAEQLAKDGFGDLLWSGAALDGRQLVAAADAVLSAGGSMNREAAVLGTPAYSLYAGKLAGVDRALVAQSRLRLVASQSDVDELRIVKKPAAVPPNVSRDLLVEFANRLQRLAG